MLQLLLLGGETTALVGNGVGLIVGLIVGNALGNAVGLNVGLNVGYFVGKRVVVTVDMKRKLRVFLCAMLPALAESNAKTKIQNKPFNIILCVLF